MIKQFNKWFDAQKEPGRFFMFLAYIFLSLVLLNFPFYLVKVVGGVLIAFASIVRIAGKFAVQKDADAKS